MSTVTVPVRAFLGSSVAAASLMLAVLSMGPADNTLLLFAVLVLAAAPLALTFRTYQAYHARLVEQQRQAQQASDLHLATLEALALAIDAKDQTEHAHIHRVQVYATGLAKALGMSDMDIQGVKTAALLHDIGKLAIPDHILSKPGALTQEEYQKVQIHAQIGAQIISSVPFPYPVAPLIRSHHERWDGKGYPDGLKGETIPLGARILTVVDYFDSIMSERPYHKGMSREAAMGLLRQEAGKALDPRLVETFVSLYPSLAAQAAGLAAGHASRVDPVPANRKDTKGQMSAATSVFEDIALAHREIYALYELAQAMGSSLELSGTMTLISSKLSNIVPYSCCALFMVDQTGLLKCKYAIGVDAEAIQDFAIKSGHGLVGWVARNRRPLVNARPNADFEAAGRFMGTTLQSALVCPLIASDQFIGALAVYHTADGVYTDDHRRLLDRISEQAAAVIQNSALFEQTQEESLHDPLTSLPNTRFMLMHLSRELTRAGRLRKEVTLLVMDLDNFKEINDTHGHGVGDRALRDVARVLRSSIRPYDICVRYAGDEFIIVLSGCGAEEAERKRLEFQRTISALRFEPAPGTVQPLGISIGAAIFPHDGESYETLLATGDSRMYRDKTRRKRQAAGLQAASLPSQPAPVGEHEIRQAAVGVL